MRPFEIGKHLKPRLFEGLISNGPVLLICPDQKTRPSKIRMFSICLFLSRVQMIFDKMVAQPLVQISNGWACGFQIHLRLEPFSTQPFEIKTSQDFQPPLYLLGSL